MDSAGQLRRGRREVVAVRLTNLLRIHPEPRLAEPRYRGGRSDRGAGLVLAGLGIAGLVFDGALLALGNCSPLITVERG